MFTEWVTPELVDEVLAECGWGGVKPGALSPRFMVCFTLGLALFAQDSYDDVAENLVGAWTGCTGGSRTGPRSPGPGSGWGLRSWVRGLAFSGQALDCLFHATIREFSYSAWTSRGGRQPNAE